MSDLENRLNQLLIQFSKSLNSNRNLNEKLQRQQTEIQNLRKTVSSLKECQEGSAAERHRIRYLEKERSTLKKNLEQLLKKITCIQEKLAHEPKPL